MFSTAAVQSQLHESVALVFYRVLDDEPSWVNRWAAWLTGTAGMSHVELRFRDGRSLSVFQDETVFLKKRGYSNRQYRIASISVSQRAEAKMQEFAQEQVGKKFNRWGLYRGVLPWPFARKTDGHLKNGRWFCSELVTATLQAGGALLHTAPNVATPNQLFDVTQRGIGGEYGNINGQCGLNSSISANLIALTERADEIKFGNTQFKNEMCNSGDSEHVDRRPCLYEPNAQGLQCASEEQPLLMPAGLGRFTGQSR